MTKKIITDPKLLNVGILGYTGETGKFLAYEVLKNDIFKSVTLIGRRVIEYKDDFLKTGVQKTVDFDKLNEYEDVFKNIDVIYCCLGTTKGKSGEKGFIKVDYDYVLESAKIARKCGCKHYHLVSSSGANKNSSLLYPRIKGQVEEEISKLGFQRFSAYRPAVIMVDREEKRPFEACLRFLLKPIQYVSPSLFTTPVEILVKSMINNTIYTDTKNNEILENSKIFELASMNKDIK